MSLRPPANTPLPASPNEASSALNGRPSLGDHIEDANFAKQQMEIVKLQILQHTSSAFYAQANSSLKSVLSFF